MAFNGDLAVDTETRGLNIALRDRLCVVQLSDGGGNAHLVQFDGENYDAPNLRKLLADEGRTKIFHYARFDLAAIKHYLDVDIRNIYCTKIASRLARTYSDKHGLKELCKEFLGVDLSKQQQSSYWGAKDLSKAQISYAAADVLYLHKLRDKLNVILEDDNRIELAQQCFDCLPARVALDLQGWSDTDIFSHN